MTLLRETVRRLWAAHSRGDYINNRCEAGDHKDCQLSSLCQCGCHKRSVLWH